MSCSVEGSLSFSLWAFRGDVPGLGTPHRTHSPHSARTHPTQTHAHHKQPQTQPRKQLPPGEIFKRNQAAPFWVCSVPPARWHRAFSGCPHPTPVCASPHCNQQQPCQLRARKAIPEAAESAWPRRGPVGAATEGCLKAALSPTAAEGGDTGQGQPRTQQDSGAPLTPPSLERARKAEALGSAGNAGLVPGWEGGSSLQPGMLA